MPLPWYARLSGGHCCCDIFQLLTVFAHAIQPEEEIKCDLVNCKFSPAHPHNCPRCQQTCWQYRQFPQQYCAYLQWAYFHETDDVSETVQLRILTDTVPRVLQEGCNENHRSE
ncbi:hypothetical protein K435DRAFT_8132 [Dendrothele bispora CBS 962.96]|uniref:Uncharacterized protein n=1 Tax=Dendrothele bispora (strain CBS 962.96) TaxID=1314807 RepID=A0A4S8MY30_DENBC|nr:hypothetical protein K435DRAFT_8132 [Dendrothele bispora CBS 962.96]